MTDCYGPMEELDPEAYSNFNSIQVVLNRRFENGFSVLGSYVYGKYLDIVSYTAEGGGGPRNPENFAQSYGPSDNDVRHRFTASYIYQLPKLKGAHGLFGGVTNGCKTRALSLLKPASHTPSTPR